MCGIKQQGETKEERYIKCKIENGIITLGSQELKGVEKYELTARSTESVPCPTVLTVRMFVSAVNISNDFESK